MLFRSLEGLNWAVVYQLPVLFVCEDNRISATTPTGPMTAGEGATARAQAMGLRCLKVDGNDVEAVDRAAGDLAAWVRAGHGPAFLHAVTYRFKGHVSIDAGAYRDAHEVADALDADPLSRARAALIAAGVSAASLDALDAAAKAEIDAAVVLAQAAPWPEPRDAYEDVMTTGAGVWR